MKKSHTVKVDIETLKSLTLWEQVSLLLGSGYILGTLNIRSLTVSEWNLLGHSVSNNEGAYFQMIKTRICGKVFLLSL